MGRLVNGLIFGADGRTRGQWQKVVPKHRGQVQFTTFNQHPNSIIGHSGNVGIFKTCEPGTKIKIFFSCLRQKTGHES